MNTTKPLFPFADPLSTPLSNCKDVIAECFDAIHFLLGRAIISLVIVHSYLPFFSQYKGEGSRRTQRMADM